MTIDQLLQVPSRAKVPHVVAVAYFTQGHINSLIHFCLELASYGMAITFVTIHFNSPNSGGNEPDPPLPDRLKNSFHFERLVLDYSPRAEASMSPDGFANFFRMMDKFEGPFEQLLLRLQEHDRKVSCVVSDCMLVWTQVVAKRMGIPRAGFWTTSLASLTVDFHVPLLLENGDIPVSEENWEKLISYVPGLPPLPARSLPVMYHSGNFMTTSDPGYKRKIARSVILKDDAWIIVNSFEELEAAGFEALRKVMNDRCIGVGPLLPGLFPGGNSDATENAVAPGVASFWKQDTTCLEWLNGKHPNSVLYISFGSVVRLTLAEFEELSRGLEQSKQSFLWAFRPGCVNGLKIEDLELFKERTSPMGLVIDWAPQVEVLSHESTGAFLTHCGWNSVLEGICGGVPLLGWPAAAEQNINCEIFMGRGIGVRLTKPKGNACPRSDEIASMVTGVLSDEEMRSRACKLRDAARKAVGDWNGTSACNLQAFVEYLGGEPKLTRTSLK